MPLIALHVTARTFLNLTLEPSLPHIPRVPTFHCIAGTSINLHSTSLSTPYLSGAQSYS
jgi:hypothetical protein